MVKLSRDSIILIAIETIFALSVALSSTYVSVYLWKLTSNIIMIIAYNAVSNIVTVCNFIIASRIGRKKSLNSALRMGILGNISFYILILILKGKASELLFLLGIVNGIGSGFYFYAVNNLTYYLTDDHNRGYFLGLSGALGAVMGAVAPLVSGYIISSGNNFIGYYKVFFFSFILFCISAILTLFIVSITEEKEFSFKRVVSNRNNIYWKKLMGIHLFAGLREASFGLALMLLTFNILKSEFNMGKLNTLSSVIGIISTYLIGYILNRRNTRYIYLTGVIMNILSSTILVIYPNFMGIIINSVLNSIFNCFWAIPFSNISYEMAGKCGNKENNVGDYVIAREIPLAIGRVFSLLIFAFISSTFDYVISMRVILFILSFMLVPMYVISVDNRKK